MSSREKSKINALDIDSLRWIYGNDSFGKPEVRTARMVGQACNPLWTRYLDGVGQLHGARRDILGNTATGGNQPSVFRRALKCLRKSKDANPDVLAALELFDMDEQARRDHFAAAERGGAVGVPGGRLGLASVEALEPGEVADAAA